MDSISVHGFFVGHQDFLVTVRPASQPMMLVNWKRGSWVTVVYYGNNGQENGKSMETAVLSRCFIGIMEKKMVTTIIYWGYIGIMEKKMEITILYWRYLGTMERKWKLLYYVGVIQG